MKSGARIDVERRLRNLELAQPVIPTPCCPVCHEPVTKEGCKCWRSAVKQSDEMVQLMWEATAILDNHGLGLNLIRRMKAAMKAAKEIIG